MRLRHLILTALCTKLLASLLLLQCFHPFPQVLTSRSSSPSGGGSGGSHSGHHPDEGPGDAGKCQEKETEPYTTECKPCDQPADDCGDGTPGTPKNCEYYLEGHPDGFAGCQKLCEKETVKEGCCDGFWGPDCQACPGKGSSKDGGPACHNNGVCNDGLDGNGQCVCYLQFEGESCQLCSEPNMYGKHCDQECPDCGPFGHCQTGIFGDGHCLCLSGYHGSTCQLLTPECEAAKCDEHAHCTPDGSGNQYECQCFSGYYMEGGFCQEINPCASNPCIDEAECISLSFEWHTCSCKDGYQGDGVTCDPVDPCETNFGGCPPISSTCHYVGPGQSYCECKAGHEGFVVGHGCSLVDVCGSFSTECRRHAGCVTVAPFTAECRCLPGYAGNGTLCYGNIVEVLTELNGEVGGQLEGQLNSALYMLRRTHESFLSRGESLTLMVATDEGYAAFENQELLTRSLDDQDLASYIMQLHIVPTALTIEEFVEMKRAFTFSGVAAEASPKPENPSVIRYRLKSGSAKSKFVRTDIPAFNGIIHVIDQLLYVEPLVQSNRSKTAFDLIKQEGKFNRLQSLIAVANFEFALHEDVGPFTVLAPTNDAWDALSSTALEFLRSPEGRSKLLQILDNHLVYGKLLDVQSLYGDSKTLVTVQQYPITVSVSEEGALQLVSSGTEGNITQVDIWASNGIIHTLSAVFVPPTAEPIVPHLCNITAYEVEWGGCFLCDQDKDTFCPPGSLLTDEIQRCDFEVSQKGCQAKCNTTVLTPDCCFGFYGLTCLPCPAGYLTPCNNHGQCMDGILGDGTCLCLPNFMGTECELCTDPSKFGLNCDQDCLCLHGICDNFINGTGECVPGSCQEGYAGANCDKQTTPCGSEDDLLCHAHAQCSVVEGVAQCLCITGYEGSGEDCVPIDPCQKDYFGQCDEFANCTMTGPGSNQCHCLEGFDGDGYACVPIDNCQLPELGGCGLDAVCIFTGPGQNECQCSFGYSGDGYKCTEINSCQFNNGGCHYFGKCISTGPGLNDCDCMAGYIGDGYSCHGSITEEIANNIELKDFYSLIETADLSKMLSTPSENLTVFAPTSSAFTELIASKQLNIDDPSVARDLTMFHLVKGMLHFDDLKEYLNDWLPTLLNGTHLIVSSSNGEDIQVNGVTIVKKDLPATNGLIHIIDFVLIPPSNMITITYPTLEELFLQNSQYLEFHYYLKSLGLLESLKTASSYTILAASNSSISSSSGSSLDKDLLMFHIIYGKRYTFHDLYKSAVVVDSWMGHNHQLTFVGEEGQVKVNHEAVITDKDLLTDKGVVHGLSVLLQITQNRCDTNTTEVTRGLCGDCSTPFSDFCPSDYQPFGDFVDCHYQANIGGEIKLLLGCQVDCVKIHYTEACCPNFFGSDCQACPGGLEPCSRRGLCDDGISGSGSCTCISNFVGDACQSCESGHYGSNCDQNCNCINGECSEVDGTCTCHSLWTGSNCNTSQSEGSVECGIITCSTNGYCLAEEELCVCHVGFEGNGINCTVKEPCMDNNGGCSLFATCSLLDDLTVECRCSAGFAGDGYMCLEINPCDQQESQLCHSLADCIHTGPDKYACVCQTGYDGDGTTSCTEVNPCDQLNGGCSDKATCTYAGPGLRDCSCLPNYIGDGFNCAGTLREEIGRISGVSQFRIKYEEYIEKFMGSFLSYPTFFTAFIPTDEAFLNFEIKNPDMIVQWSQDNLWPAVIQYHVIGCVVLTSSDLQTTQPLVSLSGLDFPIHVKENSEVELKDGGHLVYVDHAATNGIIHTIDTVLIPPKFPPPPSPPLPPPEPIEDYQAPLLQSLLRVTESLGYTIFGDLLQTSLETTGVMFDPLNGPLTLFIPSNSAWESMPGDLLQTLRNPNNYDMLQEYLQYHMVAKQALNAADLLTVSVLTTLQGSTIFVECSGRQGDIHVNGEDARVQERQIPFDLGMIYSIDWVLEPHSIGGRCDIVTTLSFMSPCVLCNVQPPCDEGFTNQGPIQHDCEVDMEGWYDWKKGCRQECYKLEVESQCCVNHYGADCRECPGGARFPCNSRGICSSGVSGNGSCDCVQGFTGVACELCMDGYYGPDCQVCQCTDRGTCLDGKLGDGSCFCDEDWAGTDCGQSSSADCAPACYPHSVCRPNNLCECLPGYVNSGVSCKLVDQCQLNNGGCHEFALCDQKETAVTCTCIDGYEGDGVFCQGIDRCQVDHGSCHENAACKYTGPNMRECECLKGFTGDGFSCNPEPLLPLKCDIEYNGGCSNNAWCTEIPPSETLPVGAIDCKCKDDYVGDGIMCNGDAFQTIETTSSFSHFFKSLVENTDASVQSLLKNMTAQITLFVPLDPEKSANQSNLLTENIVENHIVTSLVSINSLDSPDKSVKVKSMSGKKLIITTENSTLLVSGIPLIKADIPTANGILHIIQQPIAADMDDPDDNRPPKQKGSSFSTASVMAVVVIVLVLFIIILAGVYFSRRHCQNSWTLPILFTRGSGSVDDRVTIGIGADGQPTSFDNPLYSSSHTEESSA